MNTWDSLSMAQRAEVMKLAVQNGIYSLDTIRGAYNEYAKGGGIHIDPSKKGTFTAAASRHNMGVQEFASKVLANKDDYSTAMVKKANFAKNTSKWKHGDGGLLERALESAEGDRQYAYGGELGNVFDGWGDAVNFLRRGWHKVKDVVQASAVIENPAVMTAAGQRINRQGKTEFNHANDKDVRQLRSNLTSIGEAGIAAPTLVGDVEAAYQVVRHPIRTARSIKKAAQEGVKALKNRKAEAKMDKAYMRALDEGNMEDAQRLRDEHFIRKSNSKITTLDGKPAHIYHGTNADWVQYDPTKFGSATDEGYYGVGLYGTEYRPLAKGYGDNVMDLYVNSKQPFTAGTQDITNKAYDINEAVDRSSAVYYFNRGKRPSVFHKANSNTDIDRLFQELNNSDAAVYGTPNQRFNEVVIPDGKQIKLADAVTYDDAGNVIPLSQRDNFNINDIRYGLIPVGFSSWGLSSYLKNK